MQDERRMMALPSELTGLDRDIEVDRRMLADLMIWEDVRQTARGSLESSGFPGTKDGQPLYDFLFWNRVLRMERPDPEVLESYKASMGYGDWAYEEYSRKVDALSHAFDTENDDELAGYPMKDVVRLVFGLDSLPFHGDVADLVGSCFGAVVEDEELGDDFALLAVPETLYSEEGEAVADFSIRMPSGLPHDERNWRIAFGYGLLLFDGDETMARRFSDALNGCECSVIRTDDGYAFAADRKGERN